MPGPGEYDPPSSSFAPFYAIGGAGQELCVRSLSLPPRLACLVAPCSPTHPRCGTTIYSRAFEGMREQQLQDLTQACAAILQRQQGDLAPSGATLRSALSTRSAL